MTAETVLSEFPDRLRADMVAKLRESGSLRSPVAAEAFETVPREKFAPEAPLAAAYSARDVAAAYSARDVVVTKRNAAGRATSSVSAPWLQAEMIEAAGLTRGARVLEVGSGGYNAALIAEIVGPEGAVVTVDIDPWVTEFTDRQSVALVPELWRHVVDMCGTSGSDHIGDGACGVLGVGPGLPNARRGAR